jgi:hypothetical protein
MTPAHRQGTHVRRLALFASLILAGCSTPDEGAIRAEFLQHEPRAEIVGLGTGEGDDQHVYYHIRYRVPPDPAVREAVWGYREEADGRWTRFSPRPSGGSAP